MNYITKCTVRKVIDHFIPDEVVINCKIIKDCIVDTRLPRVGELRELVHPQVHEKKQVIQFIREPWRNQYLK